MDFAYNSGWISVTTLCLFLMSIVLLVSKWISHRKMQHSLFEKYGFPYVKPHSLIKGSMGILRRDNGGAQLKLVDAWLKRYGKVFGHYVGWEGILVVADLDIIQHILIKNFSSFHNRPKLVIPAEPVIDTLVGLRGKRWKDVRALINPTFSGSKMKIMFNTMNEKIDLLLDIIGKKASKDESIDFLSLYQGLSLDVISNCALALETSCQELQNNDFLLRSVREFLHYALNNAILLALYFPSVASVMTFISNKLSYSGRMTQYVVSHLKKVIEFRRQSAYKRKDLLQIMIDAGSQNSTVSNDKLAENNSNNSESDGSINKFQKILLTDKEIIANAWVFILGGFETSAALLAFTSYLLAKHEDIQERLYQEIYINTDGGDEFLYEKINKLEYMGMVLNESMRLYPPVVTFTSREANEDIQIKDVFIPKGMKVSIPTWSIHRDPEHWPDPEVFDPDRFSPVNSQNRHPMAHMPFGAGPRYCVGMRFGLLEAKLALARVLLKYKFVVCDETPDELTFEIPTVTLHPKQKVVIKPIPRKH